MVLSRLRCLDSHILANALIWFLIEAADWLLGRGGAESRHHIRRHAVDGRIKICGWLRRHSSLFEAGVVQKSSDVCWIEAEIRLEEEWSSSRCGCQCRGKSERGADILHPTVPQGRGPLG
ncbi:hypothetical protein FOXG_05431 [Fusarium oxysporum f. sp. lycopersici 4287]|uniref:Uncharacterized protein n=2 Tax=Fusarium oxysporum TaxID=5507 RepID=A0A0J9UUT1_FUSO4|nr:hypothetical protein FOXG_05431 [Fusarium oxysporum f. sp. lycopersici 4287]KNB02658.1 hypothetical protein FOXG_05431 [Fusarium oxysporum f. sp. lycopersici 4287]